MTDRDAQRPHISAITQCEVQGEQASSTSCSVPSTKNSCASTSMLRASAYSLKQVHQCDTKQLAGFSSTFTVTARGLEHSEYDYKSLVACKLTSGTAGCETNVASRSK